MEMKDIENLWDLEEFLCHLLESSLNLPHLPVKYDPRARDGYSVYRENLGYTDVKSLISFNYGGRHYYLEMTSDLPRSSKEDVK